jgi:hypothetical protein
VFNREGAVAVELKFILPSVAAGEPFDGQGEHGRDKSGFRHREIVSASANLRPACEASGLRQWVRVQPIQAHFASGLLGLFHYLGVESPAMSDVTAPGRELHAKFVALGDMT